MLPPVKVEVFLEEYWGLQERTQDHMLFFGLGEQLMIWSSLLIGKTSTLNVGNDLRLLQKTAQS